MVSLQRPGPVVVPRQPPAEKGKGDKSKATIPCSLCDQPRASAKVPYCRGHRRAHDNLSNQENFIKRTHGEGSAQWKAYVECWKEGTVAQRQKAIITYHRLFGAEGNAKGKVGGSRKACLDFSEHLHIFRQCHPQEGLRPQQ